MKYPKIDVNKIKKAVNIKSVFLFLVLLSAVSLITHLISYQWVHQTNISNPDIEGEINVSVYVNGEFISYVISDNPENAETIFRKVLDIKTKDMNYGSFITAVNNVSQGNGRFWMFYINGGMAPIGVSSYYVRNQDRLELKLMKI